MPNKESHSNEGLEVLRPDQQRLVAAALEQITEALSRDRSEDGLERAVAEALTSDPIVDRHILRQARQIRLLLLFPQPPADSAS